MKKIYIQLLIVVIGIALCVFSIRGIKTYFYETYKKSESYTLVYSDILNINKSANILETATTEVTSNEITTTEIASNEIINNDIDISTMITTKKIDIDNLIETAKEKIGSISYDGKIIYDNMTKKELVDKLNRNLNSTLVNTGIYFVDYYLKTGLDPYLAVAIVLHETGCKWECSNLVKENYNIGGLKGTNGYLKFDSLESGINGYLDILYNDYYKEGLTTPELINPKYAASETWSEKINNYINQIRES